MSYCVYTWFIFQFCGRSGPSGTHGNAVLQCHDRNTSTQVRLVTIDFLSANTNFEDDEPDYFKPRAEKKDWKQSIDPKLEEIVEQSAPKGRSGSDGGATQNNVHDTGTGERYQARLKVLEKRINNLVSQNKQLRHQDVLKRNLAACHIQARGPLPLLLHNIKH